MINHQTRTCLWCTKVTVVQSHLFHLDLKRESFCYFVQWYITLASSDIQVLSVLSLFLWDVLFFRTIIFGVRRGITLFPFLGTVILPRVIIFVVWIIFGCSTRSHNFHFIPFFFLVLNWAPEWLPLSESPWNLLFLLIQFFSGSLSGTVQASSCALFWASSTKSLSLDPAVDLVLTDSSSSGAARLSLQILSGSLSGTVQVGSCALFGASRANSLSLDSAVDLVLTDSSSSGAARLSLQILSGSLSGTVQVGSCALFGASRANSLSLDPAVDLARTDSSSSGAARLSLQILSASLSGTVQVGSCALFGASRANSMSLDPAVDLARTDSSSSGAVPSEPLFWSTFSMSPSCVQKEQMIMKHTRGSSQST